MIVLNFEVAGLIRRLRRFKYEMTKSVSSSAAAMSESDFLRAKSYLGAVAKYLRYVIDQEQLDLPESSPREIDLGVAEVLPMPENEAIVDMMVLYDLCESEMGNSQSARMPSGLISHDIKRLESLLSRMNGFLDTYISETLPLDLPESAPKRGLTGVGRTGV